MAKIYTKVGDQGQTQLVGGQKVPKSDSRIDAYGTIDELNSVIGIVRAESIKAKLTELDTELEIIQHWLFNLGSLLASSPEDRAKFKLSPISKEYIHTLEERIDEHTKVLSPLKEFILPGGSVPAAFLHQARTVARRAERLIVELDKLPENTIPFVNRLSDYFFVLARLANHKLKVSDVTWKKD